MLWFASIAVLFAGIMLSLGMGMRRRSDFVTGAIALSILIVVSLGKVLLLAGQFRPASVIAAALLCAGASAAWIAVSRAARQHAARTLRMFARRPRLRLAPPAWVAAAAASAVTAVAGYFGYLACRFPPIAWDALYYHLISVSQWVRTGSLVSPIPGMHSRATDVLILAEADTFPKDTELVAAWFAVFTHDVRLVQLAQLVFLPLLFAGTYGICRHLGVRPGWSVVAASLPVLAPAVLNQVATNYVDVAQAAAVTAAWPFLLAAFPAAPDGLDRTEGPARPRRRNLVMAGLCLGLAAGVKPTNLLFCAASLPVVVGLCAWRTRRTLAASTAGPVAGLDVPKPLRCCAAEAIPMLAVGSFWYLRTWLRWGSPTWPIAVGPFPGRSGAAAWAGGAALGNIPSWRGSPALVVLARDWAASLPALRPAGLAAYQAPGLTWLFVLLPAIIACAAIPAVRGRNLPGLLWVVAPFFLLVCASPGSWDARESILALVAGGVSLVLLLDASPPARLRRVAWQAGTGLAGSVAVALSLWQAWGVVQHPSWNVPPSVHGIRAVLALAASAPSRRRDIGNWGGYNAWQTGMTAAGDVGFFAQDPPELTLPYAGQDFSRPVVSIGDFPWSGTGPAPRWPAVERMLQARHVRYLYVPTGTAVYAVVHAHLRPVRAAADGSLLQVAGSARHRTGHPIGHRTGHGTIASGRLPRR